jgi:hypothetical protein
MNALAAKVRLLADSHISALDIHVDSDCPRRDRMVVPAREFINCAASLVIAAGGE